MLRLRSLLLTSSHSFWLYAFQYYSDGFLVSYKLEARRKNICEPFGWGMRDEVFYGDTKTSKANARMRNSC